MTKRLSLQLRQPKPSLRDWMDIHSPPLRRLLPAAALRDEGGVVLITFGAGDGENQPSNTACGIGALVTCEQCHWYCFNRVK